MRGKITKRSVDAAKAEAKEKKTRFIMWDEDVKGFGASFSADGKCTYVIQYRLGGRGTPTRRLTLGKHGTSFTPDQARQEAKKKLGEVAKGADVAQQEKDKQLRLKEGTFKAAAENYFTDNALPTRHWQQTRRIYERDAYPAFGTRPVTEITKLEIRAQLDKVRRRAPSAERKLYAALSPFFKWMAERGVETNPMMALTKPRPAKKRKRKLDPEELVALWKAIDTLDEPFRSCYRLLVLTGQRREEVAAMRWEEIDTKTALWRLPPWEEFKTRTKDGIERGRTKNLEEHIVDLSPQAFDVLLAYVSLEGTSDTAPAFPRSGLVFTTTGRTPISGFGKIKNRLDAAMEKELGSPLKPWRNHDLRRTMATHMAEFLDIDEGVIERILNHISTTEGGLKGVYQLQQYREKRKRAMHAWGAYVEGLVTGAPATSNVVPLRSPA